jgi:hypothetical protein
MIEMDINFTQSEWKSQKIVSSGRNRARFSSLFDYFISFKLQKKGLNCWLKSRLLLKDTYLSIF